ncbi:hypothetical protein GQ55_3G032800 [Panicum hallii var. hallii]|uniref:Uncharacterized protein n=1 Tax=Panicum hallii var. hallii TaxID=1504633 RepID=A0A2T7E5B2_9POAL|nr:hypothetical protein GQ55_3G032800 [Panicum hallii var. hallii]
MAIPVARVHLAMAHAALPGLLPSPPKCMMMMPPLLPTPPCAIILPSSSPPKPSRADAAERWDAHKIKPGGSPTSPSSSSGGRRSLDGESSSPGRASSCERWDSDKKKNVAAASSSASRTSSPGRSSSSRADSEERWDAHKKPMSLTSSSSSARSNTKGCDSSKRRPSSRASSTAARLDARKKPGARRTDELDDGESSTGSNDIEYLDMPPPRPLPQRALYAGPGFIASPDPSMLPMPSLMIRVAKRCNTRGMLLAKY